MADNIQVNAVAVTDANFNDTTPAASAGRVLFEFNTSGSGPASVSLETPATIPIVLDREMTDLAITNTTTETVIFTHSVPANAMGTDRSLHLILLGNITAGTAATTLTLRVKFGGTTIFNDVSGSYALDADRKSFYLELWLGNQGATNDQTGGGFLHTDRVSTYTLPTTGLSGDLADPGCDAMPITFADSALDTTVAETFEVTMQFTTAGAANVFTRKMAILLLE